MAHFTIVELYGGVPLDPRLSHTIKFTSETAQRNYFAEKRRFNFTNFAFARKNTEVRINVNHDALIDYNVSYMGVNNGAKWFYYFITEKEYKSDNLTTLHVKLDVLQTYQFDWTIPPCFVEREHVLDDTKYLHVLDEGISTGQHVINYSMTPEKHALNPVALDDMAIVIQSSATLTGASIGTQVGSRIMNKVFTGFWLYYIRCEEESLAIIDTAITALTDAGKADAIQAIWLYPMALISPVGGVYTAGTLNTVSSFAVSKTTEISKQSGALDGYTPINRKLYSYPFSFLHVWSGSGEGADYKWEKFDATASAQFGIYGNPCNDGIIRLIPRNYRGMELDHESGISLSGFPTCAWSTDAYRIWMAQNQATQALTVQMSMENLLFAGAQGVSNVVTNNGASFVSDYKSMIDTVAPIRHLMAQKEDMQTHPPQARGTQSPTTNITNGAQTFFFTAMSVDAAHAKAIDDYFSMYGYLVKTVKTPNITGRPHWNYVKTVGCVVKGDFDNDDKMEIAQIFDSGITFWHNPNIMYDYSYAVSNTPGG